MVAWTKLSAWAAIAFLCLRFAAVAQTIVPLPPVTHAPSASTRQAEAVYPVQQASAAGGASNLSTQAHFQQLSTRVAQSTAAADGSLQADGADTEAGQEVYPIDLPSALRLADRANPDIGIARQQIYRSLAEQMQARSMMLPNLTAGTMLHIHNGPLQRSSGAILSLAEKSLYIGGGSRTVGAETLKYPAVQIYAQLADAIFEPLAARQRVAASRFQNDATFNTTLLDVSTGYIDLMAAEARLLVFDQTYRGAAEVARVTTNFAEIGQGRQADADRTQTESALLNSQVQLATAERSVASAELCRLLNLDPSLRLQTVGGPIPVLLLVDPSFSLEQLVAVAVQRRPDIRARDAEVAEMQVHYRQERMRPMLPTVAVGYSAGSIGGGSNLQQAPFLVPNAFGSFAARDDFDAMAYWTMENFGVGNRAMWRRRRAQRDQNVAQRSRTVNLVREQVAKSHAQTTASRREIDVARARLTTAEHGFDEELRRIQGGLGLPIELLDNLVRLKAARLALVEAIAGYDKSQFELFVALGQPPTLALPNTQALAAPQR